MERKRTGPERCVELLRADLWQMSAAIRIADDRAFAVLAMNLMPSSPCPRRHANTLFEGAIESGLGLVANVARDLRDCNAGLLQQARGELHPPSRQVLHWCIAHKMCKSFREHGARQSNLM